MNKSKLTLLFLFSFLFFLNFISAQTTVGFGDSLNDHLPGVNIVIPTSSSIPSGGDNSSWNESYANSIYSLIGSGSDNSSWNESYANTLYSGIEWNYNQTTSTYNLYNAIWSSTYNATYDSYVQDNSSWNESHANTLYSGIEWNYNQTTATYNLYNAIWSSTYNATYDSYVEDNSSWNESYANTLYADISVTGGNASWNESYANDLYLPHTVDTTIGNCSVEGSCSSVTYIDYLNTGNFNVSGNITAHDVSNASRWIKIWHNNTVGIIQSGYGKLVSLVETQIYENLSVTNEYDICIENGNCLSQMNGNSNCNSSGSCSGGDVAYMDIINTGNLNVSGNLNAINFINIKGGMGFETQEPGTDYLTVTSYTNHGTKILTNNTKTSIVVEPNGDIGFGTTPATKFHTRGGSLGTTKGNYKQLLRREGITGNYFQNNLYTYRNANGSDWITASWHDSIGVDAAFQEPQVSSLLWWERNPGSNTMSWGHQTARYMTLSSGKLAIGLNTNPTHKLTVLGDANITSTVTLGSLSGSYGGGSAYVCVQNDGTLFTNEIGCP